MFRILIEPSTFEILPLQNHQNPYIDVGFHADKKKVNAHYAQFVSAFFCPIYKVSLPRNVGHLPDIVFCASVGLALPRLSGPLVLLPNMKYAQRKAELPHIRKICKELSIPTVDYPGKEPFEGQAELKWFDGGRKAVLGYGYRSTKQTVQELKGLFAKIYGKDAPQLLGLHIHSPKYYHLDIAMLEYSNKCIVHKDAFSQQGFKQLREFLGPDNVTIVNTSDSFGLNAIVENSTLITHKLTDPSLLRFLERTTGLSVVQVDTSEFEKSGGSVRCMAFDV